MESSAQPETASNFPTVKARQDFAMIRKSYGKGWDLVETSKVRITDFFCAILVPRDYGEHPRQLLLSSIAAILASEEPRETAWPLIQEIIKGWSTDSLSLRVLIARTIAGFPDALEPE